MRSLTLSLFASLALSACADDSEISLKGNLPETVCTLKAACDVTLAPYDLSGDYAAMLVVDDTVEIRLQRDGRLAQVTDTFTLQIQDSADVTTGDALNITANGPIQAGLLLGETCGSEQAPLQLVGTVTFSAFGTDERSHIAGRLDLTATHGRDQSCSWGALEGSFDFERSPSQSTLGRK